MIRTIIIFGVLAGAIPIATIIFTMQSGNADTSHTSVLVGYTIMLIALSLMFVGLKRYRDHRQGGVIRFWPDFGMGLGIAAVAGLTYAIGWELFLWGSGYDFMDGYARAMIAAKEAEGASAGEIAKLRAEMAELSANYANPLFRIPMTFVEIFPLAAVVALVSAALLRNSRFLPARQAGYREAKNNRHPGARRGDGWG